MGCGEIGGGEMSIEITPALLADLRTKAEAAEGGEWKVYNASDGSIFITGDDEGPHLAEVWWPKEANHMAAASPAVVLALVDEIKRLNERFDEQKRLATRMIEHTAEQKKEIERLRSFQVVAVEVIGKLNIYHECSDPDECRSCDQIKAGIEAVKKAKSEAINADQA